MLFIPLAALSCLLVPQANAQILPNFENEGKNIPGFPEPNARFVVLSTGVATITAQKFALPKDTWTFPLAGMTVFPYYQASEPLKEFLNNANTMGIPLTQQPIRPNLPTFSLPATDLVRWSIPIPKINENKNSAVKMAVKDRRAKDEIPWMVAHQGGQIFGLPGDSEGLIMVSSGTMFGACSSRTMVLRCGTMWVMTGARPAAVLTKYGAVGVKAHSIAAVEQTWFNRVKAVDLYGQALEVMLSQNQAGQTHQVGKLSVEKGKELTLSDSAVASSGTSDYAAGKSENGEEITGKSESITKTMPDLRLFEKKLDPSASAFVNELKVINPPFSNPKMASDYDRMFEQFGVTSKMRREAVQKNEVAKSNLAKKNAVYKVSLDSKYYVPVYTRAGEKSPSAFPQVSEELNTINFTKGIAKCLESSDLKLDNDGKPTMTTGEALVAANEPVLMQVNDCRVWINAGAMVHIIARKDLTVVQNVSEAKPNCVKVRAKGRNIECPLGAELIVGTSAPQVFTEMKNDGVARRNVHSIEITDGTCIMNKAEVDLTSLMRYSPIMSKIYKSQDPGDKKFKAQLMKANVTLNMVSQSHGSYRKMAGLPSAQ